ncbi:non-ribosomal peptide synthase/polyketide synthase [Sorangium sp. So ce1335]|uniref:non-ribosomal peptide synthase/polyketide synthase n=1 Tax=Sorangium sp. So ce1335 TaxID=3133335 RepID=UPI003F615FDA
MSELGKLTGDFPEIQRGHEEPCLRDFPLTPSQNRLWVLTQLDPESPTHHVHTALRLRGTLNDEVLRRAFGLLVRRHEALRTHVALVNESPCQRVAPEQNTFELSRLSLASLPEEERAPRFAEIALEHGRARIDLLAAPLWRALLVQISETEHRLLFTAHHFILDGWSIGILTRELGEIYAALLREEAPELPPARAYAAAAAEELSRLEPTRAVMTRFFEDTLASAPGNLPLPFDASPGQTSRSDGARIIRRVDPGVAERLAAAGQANQATTFMMLLAALGLLMQRWTEQDDIVLGTVISGRSLAAVRSVVGDFTNIVPLRLPLKATKSGADAVAVARDATMKTFRRAMLPFQEIVRAAKREGFSTDNPLFNVGLVLHSYEAAEGQPFGDVLRGDLELLDNGTAEIDLLFDVAVRDGALLLGCKYRSAAFLPETIERLLARFECVLRGLATPELPSLRLTALPDAEIALLDSWNETARRYEGGDRCLHEVVEATVDAMPNATAIETDGATLSYAELEARANRLASRLRRAGVGPGAYVALLLERSAELVVSLLAVLKAGAAYVPIDPGYPAERIAFIIEDAGAAALIVHAATRGRAPAPSAINIVDVGDEAALAQEPPDRPTCVTTGRDHAYVIYTSGSTGAPKGAINHHEGITNRILWMREALDLRPGDRVLQKTPYTFDVSVWEFFLPLVVGATVVVAPRDAHRDLALLLEVMRRGRVSVVHFVPSVLGAILQDPGFGDLPALRVVVASGEALSKQVVERFFARSNASLVNLYGPTEAAVDVTMWRCAAEDVARPSIPIGKPIANVRMYVVDRHGERAAIGAIGELVIGGVAVGNGYLNRLDLTRSHFVTDCFSGVGRLYRTGDRARFLPDGNIEFHGRFDDQVKIRGLRIELGEIESALAQLPAVRGACVLARSDGDDKRLVAYLLTDGAPPSASALRAFLKNKIPEYMIPSAFITLDAFPVTPNGKLDRAALPAPAAWAAEIERRYVAPRTPTEEALASIWQDVLAVDRIGALDHFFDLGGHSLLATQVVSRVRQRLAVELPVRAIFEAPTLERMAAHIEEALQAGAAASGPPLVPVARSGQEIVSYGQQRLWFLDQLQPGSAAYHIAGAVRLKGVLDVPALERALGALLARHEALRARFVTCDGEPRQVIDAAVRMPLPLEDLSTLAGSAQVDMVQRWSEEVARQSFDLSKGPLIRVALLRLSAIEHVLQVGMHHIVSDGWSLGIFIRELGALYVAEAHGGEALLPALPLQYADYAAWQRRWLEAGVLDQQLAYWQGQLAGCPARLELPTDRPRPRVATSNGASISLVIDAALAARLRALANEEGATLFMALLGAYQALLGRYAGQTDVVVGIPIANRQRREIEGLIGFFVNTLALRTRFEDDPTVRELLRRVKEATLEAYAHQDVPFERVVEHVNPERAMDQTPLFQAMLVLQNAPEAALALPGLAIEPIEREETTAQYDLTLTLTERDQRILGTLCYNTDLFDRSTIEQMGRHLLVLIERMVAAPDARILGLPLLDDDERSQIIEAWNGTAVETARNLCAHAIFEAQVDKTPDAVAVVFEGKQLSYRELNEQANQLAHHLRKRGVGPEILVGISMHRSPEMIIAVLGTMKAGGAYVPLDPTYPADRLAFMLEDASVKVLLTQARVVADLPAHRAEVLCLDSGWSAIAAESRENPTPLASARNIAYVIYTSGSTGKPKGVIVEHNGLVNVAEVQARAFGVGLGSRVLQLASLSFDASVWEIVMALLNGGTLVLASTDALLPGPDLLKTLIDHRITVLTISPSVLAALPSASLPDLRTIVVAGEACSEELVSQWAPGRQFIDAYGPTEASICASMGECFAGGGKPSIGKPIANTRIVILDAEGQLLPIGVPGELCVGGVGVARGYLNLPELTAERFVPDPFGTELGARLYRTGDRARWRNNGELEFLGRLDHQVKLRGCRVEIGEIEHTLSAHPAVVQAVVVVREDRPGDRRLVAYVVAGDAPPEPTELRDFLAARLPEYMVPSAFVPLAALPLTPNGKVDHKALPAPEWRGDEAGYVAPRDVIEERLVEIWQEVLAVDRIGALDHFFELGGHSLLAIQIIARARDAFEIEVPLRALFEAPTVATLAARIKALRAEEERCGAPPIEPAPRDRPLPLSFAQERFWFLHRLEPDQAHYNIPAAIELSGPLDAGALARALAEIVRRHEVLRTTFTLAGAEPVQKVQPPGEVPLPLVDLGERPPAERGEALRDVAAAEARIPFDLAASPIRALLVRLGPKEHVLLLTLHHIVCDARTAAILDAELGRLYEAFRRGEPSPLADPPLQYADYAVWQRRSLAGEVLDRQLAYWKKQLAGVPHSLDLPADHPRPPVMTYRGACRTVSLPASLRTSLSDLSRRQGVTLFITLLAAFDVLLHRWSGQDDIVVGTPMTGRIRPETEDMVGCFLNTLVIRARLSDNVPFEALLRSVREACLSAYAHQDLPFERLVQELSPERDLSRTPVFQVMFTLQSTPGGEMRGRSLPGVLETAKVDLLLSMVEGPSGITASFEYATDLFDASTIDRMAAQLGVLLEAIVAAPGAPIGDLPLLPQPELHRLLVAWNATARAYPEGATLADLFEAQVNRTPGAPALRYPGPDGVRRQLTYRELEARVNRLAALLREHGVGPDVPVGVFMDRSVALVTSVLAILAAGGAYVPLDPSYPRERLAVMLEDTRIPILLVQERYADALPPHGARLLRVGDETDTAAAPRVDRAGLSPDNLAYIVFTSGSTGRPKGVAMPHRPLVNLVAWQLATSPGARRTLQLTSPSFDVFFQELFTTWCAGGVLSLLTEEQRRDVHALRRTIADEEVERVYLPPVALYQLAEAKGAPPLPPTLREIVTAGEQLQITPQVAALLGALPSLTLRNQYGPSETHVVTEHALAGAPSAWPALPPIGRPVANARLYVLDAHLRPAPIGVPGQLYVGGVAVARGYAGRPDLTAERFVPDPFGCDGGRLYRTGDLVRYRQDGAIEFLGRADHQVKVRGYRVELGEIEVVLSTFPAVREAVVIARDQGLGDRRLVAYFTRRDDDAPAPSREDLRAFLSARLPEYMIPVSFVPLDALPLTPTGKVDRRALPAPEARAAESESRYVAPCTPTEEALAAIWQEVLAVDRIGALDHFFDLGGHSLLATQVVSRVRDRLQVELPLRALFEAPTVRALASRVRAQAMHADEGPIRRVPRGGLLATSPAQERLWILHQLDPSSSAYNMAEVIRLRGPLDRVALAAAFDALVSRHEVLRTRIVATDEGVPAQVIDEPRTGVLRFEDARGLSDERVDALVAEHAQRPFDLAGGPLFRATLFARSADEHVLSIVQHHVVSDGWSHGILVAELTALYARLELAPLPVQYADYAAWQQARLGSGRLEADLAYWQRVLADAPRALDLPTDRPRPAVESYRGGTVDVPVEASVSRALVELARAHGATSFMVLLAAFGVFLSRHAGQSEIVVGTPVAGRARPELEGLVGCFVNTVPIVVRVDAEASFASLLAAVKESTLEALAHDGAPFEKVVEAVSPPRDLGRNPIFQAMLALHRAPAPPKRVADVTFEQAVSETTTTKFDLSLYGRESDGSMTLALEYASDLFERATAERFADRLAVLLTSIAEPFIAAATATPDAPIGSLRMMPDAERELVLNGFNDTRFDYDLSVPVPQLFERQAALTPDRVATVDEHRQLTYAELHAESNAVAWALRTQYKVGKDVIVALLMDRSVNLTVAILGILKAGGAYLPLNKKDPADRLHAVLGDSGASVALVDADWARQRLEGTAVLDLREPLAPHPENLPPVATPSNVAYCIYTSGSTGTPNGVLVEHGALVNRLLWMRDELALAEDDVILQKTPYSFDVSVWELLLPPIIGAVQVMLRPDGESDPSVIRATIVKHGVTALHFVPAMLNQYVSTAEGGWTSVRHVVCSGEALDRDLANRFLKATAGGKTQLHNYYGPTEATIDVSRCRIEAGAAPITIGRPAPNNRLYVLGPTGQPCPIGVTGELFIAGVQLGRGYLNRPALNAERYIADPFRPGDRMYRTGDLARWLPSGELLCLGRTDSQVKVRGFRIELAEVEHALRGCPCVDGAAVLVQRRGGGDDFLCAYVAGASCPPPERLRELLAARLPEYMIPSHYAYLSTFPVNRNGKVDRKALAAMSGSVTAAKGGEAPRSRTEADLLDLWRALLPDTQAGVTDDFFAVGGTSLTAIQLASRITKRFGVQVGIAEIFRNQTVAAQARVIEAAAGRRSETGVTLRAYPRREDHRLSPAQERMWFLHMLEPNSAAYHIRILVELTGPLDPRVFREALADLVERQEILRTVFVANGGRACQVPRLDLPLPFELREVGAGPDQIERIRARSDELARRPFNLETESPLRVVLFEASPDEHYLLVVLHHIAGDGWSMRLLVKEISLLYMRRLGRRAVELPALPLQYVDYAESLAAAEHERRVAQDLDFWRARLRDCPILELPTDVSAGTPDPTPASPTFQLPLAATARLKELAKATSSTPFEVIMATLSLLLSRLSDQRDIVVGFPIANRQFIELESVIGLFLNTLVVRTDLSGDPTFAELLGKVSAGIRDAYDHQLAPFERVVEEVNPVRRLDRTPIFDVLLNYLEDQDAELRIDGVSMKVDSGHYEVTAKYALTVYVWEESTGLRFELAYRRDLFTPARAATMLNQLRALLEQVIETPHGACSTFSLLNREEHAAARAAISSRIERSVGRPVTESILGWRADAGGAVAIEQGDTKITYAELADRVEALAQRLVASDCRPGDVIVLTGPRSIGFVVGLLAVFRSGAVAFPLNPALPEARRRQLMTIGKPVRAVVVEDPSEPTEHPDLAGLPQVRIAAGTGSSSGGVVREARLPAVDVAAAAYLFFTSGTTGTPRGVLGWHGALRHFLDWQRQTFRIATTDRCAQTTNVSFDVMLRDTLLALVSGGTLVIPEPTEEGGGDALIRWLARKRITVLHAAPTVFHTWLLDAPADVGLGDLRWLFLAGEPLRASLVDRFRAQYPGPTRIVNLYGPTETTMAKFSYEVPRGPLPPVLPVGFPQPQCQGFVMRGDRFCGVGEPGEIVIRTPFRTRGYLDGQTGAGGFVPNPFDKDADDLLYRTGDQGRLRPDGALEVIGRLDHEVKISGVRIQPAEVESVLGRHPAVAACIVIPHREANREPRLVAYVIARTPDEQLSDRLRTYLGTQLPQAMVPGEYILIDRLPTTANGKVDRAALPQPGAALRRTVPPAERPHTPVEADIAAIWAEVLERPVPSKTDNFFELGGTSLKLLRLFHLLNARYPGAFRVAQLFSSPTIAEQAKLVEANSKESQEDVKIHDL